MSKATGTAIVVGALSTVLGMWAYNNFIANR